MSLENAFETARLYKPLRDLADAKKDIYTSFLLLPGLISFWPMSAITATGGALDLAQGSGFQLSANGQPVYGFDNAPYVTFDGDDSLSHLDTSIYDVSGAESHIDPSIQGATLGGWFRHNALATAQAYIAKYGDSGALSYILHKDALHDAKFVISANGTSVVSVTGPNLANATWYFVVGRFVPNSELAIFVSGVKTTAATTAATIFNSSAQIRIGADDSTVGRHMTGRASLCFLCATALPDDVIDNLFQLTRDLFGV